MPTCHCLRGPHDPANGFVGAGGLAAGQCGHNPLMVPSRLRWWFVVHFVLDVAAALPLFIAPTQFLGFLGWPAVDPIASRLVAAALFGIGIESYLGRNADVEAFRAMLNLKVIWSASAAIGVLWSQIEGGPPAGWGVFAIFAGFNVIWVRYRFALSRP